MILVVPEAISFHIFISDLKRERRAAGFDGEERVD